MALVSAQQVLILILCSSVQQGATITDCMKVLLSEEFQTTCSTLGRNYTKPCVVQTDEDENVLKRSKVIGGRSSVPRNRICAALIGEGEAHCISVGLHLKNNPQQNWQWAEWSGTSPNIKRKFAITEGNTHITCPYEENYFEQEEVFTDCLDALNKGKLTSGIYRISPDGSTQLNVYCEQELDGGGWTIFQRRQNGEVDFKRTWAEFKEGFGNVGGEHWLGNDYIHLLTKNHDQRILFRLQSGDDEWASAHYSTFWIEDESDKYRLTIGGYSGAAVPGDSMDNWSNGKMFTTKDQDNDVSGSRNCAVVYLGAWWHGDCMECNPNGVYGSTESGKGLSWSTWKGHGHSMVYTAIMVRRNSA